MISKKIVASMKKVAKLLSGIFTKDSTYIITSDIKDEAFIENQHVKKVIIKSPVKHIGKYAFTNCNNLKKIKFPSTLESIDVGAFYGCGISHIDIPKNVTVISEKMFCTCRNLKEINIPANVTSIYNDAFAYCTGLTSITFPKSIKEIGGYVLNGCVSLESIRIECATAIFDPTAFYGCDTFPTFVTEK